MRPVVELLPLLPYLLVTIAPPKYRDRIGMRDTSLWPQPCAPALSIAAGRLEGKARQQAYNRYHLQ